MLLGNHEKSPTDRLDYDTDFYRWLVAGDTIATATASFTGTTTLAVDDVTWTGNAVKVWVTGGVDGDSETLKIVMTTVGGRTVEVCYRFKVKGC